MQFLVPEITNHGIIARDCLSFHGIRISEEKKLTINGEISIRNGIYKNYKIQFHDVIYLNMTECELNDEIDDGFGVVRNSVIIKKFQNIDVFNKLSCRHKHFYLRTFSRVFEIVATNYQLAFSTQ